MRFLVTLLLPCALLAMGSTACEDPDFGAEDPSHPEPVETAPRATGEMAARGGGQSIEAALASIADGTIPAPLKITKGTTPGQGVLRVTRGDDEYELPLVHTDVDAEVAGFVADIELHQVYANPFDEPIEATYLFPLPDDGAVDDMEMHIGDRIIVAEIHRREEARQIYEEARDAGQAAALLEQERPNMFTQSVANIMPGEAIEVVIHVVQPLKYEDGGYEWVFPTVVGPRFIPAQGTGASGGTSPAEDADRLAAPYSPDRTGNDITLRVFVDAGMDIADVRSPSHDIVVDTEGHVADVTLQAHETIPNKDFILRYDVAGEVPETGLLTHRGDLGGYFMLMIQPQDAEFVTDDVVTPKEMVFVVDTSCSMSGEPLSRAKEAMELAISEMNPDDHFYVMDFNTTVSSLSPTTLPNTAANRERGLRFVRDFRGERGTNMLEGIKASLDLPKDPELLRTVLFMTDGYIGNESEILAAVEERLDSSRLYSFGVGSSVNRYLLDRMSKVGRGHVQYVRQDEASDEAISAFYERIRNPLLTDIEIDWDGVEVTDVYPDPVTDLFSGQPIVLVGRYDTPGEGTVTVRGKIRGKAYEQVVEVSFPEREEGNEGLASLWARTVVEDLESRQYGGDVAAISEEITEIALRYRLMTKYTSFVAVEERIINEDGTPKRVRVPLETPQGVDHGAIFGEDEEDGIVGLLGSTASSSGSVGLRRGGGGSGYGMGAGAGGQSAPRGAYRQDRKRAKPKSAPGGVLMSPSPSVMAELEPSPEEPAEPRLSARVTAQLAGGTDTLDRRLLGDLQARLRPLQDLLLQHGPDVAGEVGTWRVRIHMSRDGKVKSVEILEDKLHLPELAAELQTKAMKWWLSPPTDGEETTFEFEVTFALR